MEFDVLHQIHGSKHEVVTAFPFAAAQGRINGARTYNKFGSNSSVGTSIETVWTPGGLYPERTSAETVYLSSTNVNDTAAGSGARKIWIQGLDSNYNEIEEIVELNGQTGVVCTKQYIANYRMRVYEVGSGGEAAGDVYLGIGSITSGVPDTIYAHIKYDGDHSEGQTLMCVYQVPAGFTAYIGGITANLSKGDNAEVELYVKPYNEDVNGNFEAWQSKKHYHVYESLVSLKALSPIKVTEKSKIEIRTKSVLASVSVSADWDMILIKNF